MTQTPGPAVSAAARAASELQTYLRSIGVPSRVIDGLCGKAFGVSRVETPTLTVWCTTDYRGITLNCSPPSHTLLLVTHPATDPAGAWARFQAAARPDHVASVCFNDPAPTRPQPIVA